MADHDPNAPTLFDLDAPTKPFMDLENPEYAYMFGFLQADGHLAQGLGKKGALTVELNARDLRILEEFQRLTPYNSFITERVRSTNFAERAHSATWALYALEARTAINDLGIPYGKKSRTIRPPRGEFSRPDYIRGLIDADGSLGFTGAGLPFVSLTTQSTAIGAYLCHYAKKVTGARRTITRNGRDGIYNVLYTTETAQQLAAHLYYPGCLALDRKRSAADALSTWTRPAEMKKRAPRIDWTPERDRVLLAAPTLAEAAAALRLSQSACQVRRWKLTHGIAPLPD
ncbi:hypothetical protein [Streptomyces sp. NPDC048659]|uniref:hypothetical protein n=1 Tax=Streptomyces sp. NPDC048659 TaxID=3155489 RepID=UPI00343A07C1